MRTGRRAQETAAMADLPGGRLAYTLRRTPRARRLRVIVDPRRGVVVTVPASGIRRLEAERDIAAFLGEREAWLRRHLDRQALALASVVSRAALAPGSILPFRGEPHSVRIEHAGDGSSRSSVSREGGDEVDELVVRLAAPDRRAPTVVLERWLVERARAAIEREIGRHAGPLGVAPAAVSLRDPRTRWGSASRTGRLSFSWRLVLAPPDALETVVVHELAHLRVFGHGPEFWALVASRRPDHREWRRWLRLNSVGLHAVLADR